MKFKNLIRWVMSVCMVLSSVEVAYAQEESGLMGDIKVPDQASEFIYRSSPKESLISVQLLGAVGKPGIYYVPAGTDLLKLLTLAGGGAANGDLSEIMVRKMQPKSWEEIKSKAMTEYQGAYEVDAEKFIKYGGARDLKLAQDDFVYVPAKTALISTETSRAVALVSVVLTIALTAILIQRDSRH